SVAYAYYHLQQAHLMAGNYKESIKNGEKAAETLAGNPGTSLLMLSLTATEEAYQAMDGEMPNFRNLIKKSDAFFKTDDEWLMHRRQMSSLYNAEKTDEFIDYQKSEIGALEQENIFHRRLLWLITGGLVLIFGVGFLIRSRNFAQKEKKIQEKFSHELLKYQEDERKRISRDLHDSIGQSLVLIKNRIQLQDAESTVMLAETLEEVRSISRQLHPVLLEKLGLTAAIEKVVAEADQNSDIFIESEIEQVDGLFSPDAQLHIYRIVQESVSNVVKHSKAKSASVKAKVKEKEVHFKIRDHGEGFDLIADPSKLSSLGMQTLKERTKILGGKLLIESNTGVGTSIVLVLRKSSNA
ncbi:MAG: sensor histidine kinase, partial [Cyclobacteriaceae bacterium]